jgi:hypothetical protein
MATIRRIGLTRDPPDGWPLDRLFVGVATLRTTRELFSQAFSQRAWDLSLRTGVSPQGSANSLERLRQLGLVREYLGEPWEASRFRLDSSHYLFQPLADLFAAERDACRAAFAAERKSRSEARRRGPRGGSAAPPDGSSTPT